mmetsp:Transcript_38144/g.82978  ORF Transcript_38144/g.82978 Transcript_38144/m.82978 type:complete len:532 (-) Transcript_38144:1245-2840(-)
MNRGVGEHDGAEDGHHDGDDGEDGVPSQVVGILEVLPRVLVHRSGPRRQRDAAQVARRLPDAEGEDKRDEEGPAPGRLHVLHVVLQLDAAGRALLVLDQLSVRLQVNRVLARSPPPRLHADTTGLAAAAPGSVQAGTLGIDAFAPLDGGEGAWLAQLCLRLQLWRSLLRSLILGLAVRLEKGAELALLLRGELREGALLDHATVLHHQHLVGSGEHVQCVGHQHHRAALQEALDARFAEVLPDVRVHRREGVVQKDGGGRAVAAARQCHARLLPAGQVDPALSDLRLVPGRQHLKVASEGAGAQHLLVPLGVHGEPEQDVVLHRGVHDPWHLRGVGARPLDGGVAPGEHHLTDEGLEQRRLAGAHHAHHHHQLARLDLHAHVLEAEVLKLLGERFLRLGVLRQLDCHRLALRHLCALLRGLARVPLLSLLLRTASLLRLHLGLVLLLHRLALLRRGGLGCGVALHALRLSPQEAGALQGDGGGGGRLVAACRIRRPRLTLGLLEEGVNTLDCDAEGDGVCDGDGEEGEREH